MTNRNLSFSEVESKFEERRRRTNRYFFILAFVVVAILLIWDVTKTNINNTVRAVDIENMEILSSSSLCPGERLSFQYDVISRGQGPIVVDMTVWRVDPPKTIIYSEGRRSILESDLDHTVVETWVIPEVFANNETGNYEKIPAGEYKRYLSISSHAQQQIADVEYVTFHIKENCK